MEEPDLALPSGDLAGDHQDLDALPAAVLFGLYARLLRELTSRKLIRTANAPAGDYAEYLANRVLDGELAPNSEKCHDLVCERFGKVQVKARVVSEKVRASQRQTSPFRSQGFDWAALVMLAEADYAVARAVLVPRMVIVDHWTWKEHVNGHILFMRPDVLDHAEAVDITDEMRDAARAL